MSSEPLELSEEEIVDAVAKALGQQGLGAVSQDTGGGMNCVVIILENGGEIVWGTADVTWGAAIHNADGEYVSAIRTDCPSDSQDITRIVEAIRSASLSNGAVSRP